MQTILLAIFCGALVGFCLGALGGGGGILVWPALVFGIGCEATEASLLAKIIVGTSALFAATLHARRGTLDYRKGLLMAAIGAVGSAVGGRFIELTGMDEAAAKQAMVVLLLVLMFVVAGLMLRKGLKQRSVEANTAERSTDEPQTTSSPTVARLVAFSLASLWIGFLTGFLGVGGGFMIVPVLVFVFDMPMKIAAGTSLGVISVNCFVGIAASRSSEIRWDVALLFAVSSIVASFIAVRVTGRTRQSTLQIAFSGLIVVLAALTFWKLSRGG